MTEQSTLPDIVADKTGNRPSADICRWTDADVDIISADAGTKISMSTHLCEVS